MNGFACIGLEQPKFAANVGSVLRAAHCYGVAQVNISGMRTRDLDFKANTPKAHRHMPTFMVSSAVDYLPVGTDIVAVDLVDDADPLPAFIHPKRAFYVFGPEDGTLGDSILSKAKHRVYIPTRNCMNLAATVNVVLYDRLCKGAEFGDAFEAAKQSTYKRKVDA